MATQGDGRRKVVHGDIADAVCSLLRHLREQSNVLLQQIEQFDHASDGINAAQMAHCVINTASDWSERDTRILVSHLLVGSRLIPSLLRKALQSALMESEGALQSALYQDDALRTALQNASALLSQIDQQTVCHFLHGIGPQINNGYLQVTDVAFLLRALCPSVSTFERRAVLFHLLLQYADHESANVPTNALTHTLGVPKNCFQSPSVETATPSSNALPGVSHLQPARSCAIKTHDEQQQMLPIALAPNNSASHPKDSEADFMMQRSHSPFQNSRESVVRAMKAREQEDLRLRESVKLAQMQLAEQVDWLKRHRDRACKFCKELDQLIEKIESSGGILRQQVIDGFQHIREMLDAREQELLSQADDVAAERLSTAKQQRSRVGQVKESFHCAIDNGENACSVDDPAAFLDAHTRFSSTVESLKADQSFEVLDETAGTDELSLVFQAEPIKPYLRRLLVLLHSSESYDDTIGLHQGAQGQERSVETASIGCQTERYHEPDQHANATFGVDHRMPHKALYSCAFFNVSSTSDELASTASLVQQLRLIGDERAASTLELASVKQPDRQHLSLQALLATLAEDEQEVYDTKFRYDQQADEQRMQSDAQEAVAWNTAMQDRVQQLEHQLEARAQELQRLHVQLTQLEQEKAEAEQQKQQSDTRLAETEKEFERQQEEFERRLESAIERSEALLQRRESQSNTGTDTTGSQPKQAVGRGFKQPQSASFSGSGSDRRTYVMERITNRPGASRPYNGQAVTRDDRTAIPVRLQAASEKQRR